MNDAPPVAVTGRFVFHSRFQLNLHDALIRSTTSAARDVECVQGLSEDLREGWDWAAGRYRDIFAGPEGRQTAIIVRFHLAGFGDAVKDELGPMPREVQEALDAAAEAYRACWWRADDEQNRRWIATHVPMIDRLEDDVATRLAAAYQTPWDTSSIAVDLVPYVSRQGGNTVLEPHHILISSSNEGYRGSAALEMIFHEASHTIIGSRTGEPSRQLRRAAERLGTTLPRELWHVVLFFTTGEVVRELVAELGEQYSPYLYARGLFERAWPEFREPMETWWLAYLRGEIEMTAAVEGLLRAALESGMSRRSRATRCGF